MAKAKPKTESESETVDAVKWIDIRVPVRVDFDRGAYTPKKVTVGWLIHSQRLAMRALLEGMQEEGCLVQMASTANTDGRQVDRWHHPLLYILDAVARELP